MKDFLKYTLATVVGIIVAGIVLFFVGLGLLFNSAAADSSDTHVERGTVVRLDLSGTLAERDPGSPLLAWLLGDDLGTIGLDDVLATIRKARDNDRIVGIYLRPSLSAGYASLREIREALLDFRRSGKFVVAYADIYTQRNYYLASAADRILLNPQGMIEWKGLSGSPMYYKDLLQKIGVEMQVFKVGTYKSAVEPYLANDISPASREQITVYQQSLWRQMLDDIAASRHLTTAELDQAAERMMVLREATECLDRHLADTLVYESDVKACLKVLAGLDEDATLPMLTLAEMKGVKRAVPKDKSGNIIAVYYAEGEIVSEASSLLPLLSGNDPVILASKVVKDLDRLRRDKDVRAVVLRINSPGGSAYSAEQIWHAVEQLKAEKPVVVSMGDVAASGGYYIAAGADCILAEPNTLTGSIGIYGMFPNLKGLNDLVGLHYATVKTHPLADFEDYNRPMTDTEKAIFQNYIEHGYELFLSRCCAGRGMDRDAMDRIAQGRVWAGSMALELGLVDELGGLDRAIEKAVALADVEGYTLLSYPEPESLMEQVYRLTGNTIRARTAHPFALMRQQIEAWRRADVREWVQARLPFELDMN